MQKHPTARVRFFFLRAEQVFEMKAALTPTQYDREVRVYRARRLLSEKIASTAKLFEGPPA
jgi:hypothetical protein